MATGQIIHNFCLKGVGKAVKDFYPPQFFKIFAQLERIAQKLLRQDPMEKKSPWLPLILSLTVFPGLGHFYLNKRGKGILYVLLTALILMGGLARWMSVLFALANVRPLHGNPVHRALELVSESWRLDAPILLAFTGALVLVWLLAAVDCWWTMKELRDEK